MPRIFFGGSNPVPSLAPALLTLAFDMEAATFSTYSPPSGRLVRWLLGVLVSLLLPTAGHGWGFFAHRRINRLAVFTLPPEMLRFYKYHITYLSDNAVNPDQRRYTVVGEAPRHYLDADRYGDSALYKLPRSWKDAVAQYTEDTLLAHGTVPWHLQLIKYQLTEAFRARDAAAILRLSADLGHYAGDASVPLHTTSNYNGQFTDQVGIHGFWESRLPELFADDYDLLTGQANYLDSPQRAAWGAVQAAHAALDSVLGFERALTARFAPDQKYGYEERNGLVVRVYSRAFAKAYDQALAGQVARRLRAAVKLTGDLWYTCWVDAGQPDLDALLASPPAAAPPEPARQSLPGIRPEDGGARRSQNGPTGCGDGDCCPGPLGLPAPQAVAFIRKYYLPRTRTATPAR